MKASIHVYDGIKNIDKTREFAAEIDIWDGDWVNGELAWIRRSIKEEFADYDPVVIREFYPSYDAFEYTTYLTMAGKMVRLDYHVELTADSISKPIPKYPHTWCVAAYKRLLEEAGLREREGYDMVAYGCRIQYECGEKPWPHRPEMHNHTILPVDYNWRKYPNFFGWAVGCDGNLEAVCAKVKAGSKDHGYLGALHHEWPQALVNRTWISAP